MLLLRRLLVLAYILTAGGLQASAADESCGEPLRVRVSADYLPFSYQDTDGTFNGVDVRLIQDLFAETGCQVSLVAMPFKRAIVELAEGRIDMMPFASITEDRKAFAAFSAPYRKERAGLVVRAEDLEQLKITSLKDVVDQKLVLGHEQSAYRGPDFARFLADPVSKDHVFNVVTTTEGIRMLASGRIDALVEAPAAILAAAEQMGLAGRFAEHPFTLIEEPVHFMYSRKSVPMALIEALDQALAREITLSRYQNAYGSLALLP